MTRTNARRIRHGGALALTALLFPAAATAQGRFQVQYAEPPAQYADMAGALRESGEIEQVADFVAAALVLPHDVPVIFDTCGTPNAAYHPDVKAIRFCYEFVDLFGQIFAGAPDSTEDSFVSGVMGSTLFFMLHEMGHALVDVLDIPITGREEDAVDDLAALIIIFAGEDESLFAAIESFDALAAAHEAGGVEMAFWDEHSLSIQRAFTLDCMIYGSDPETYAGLVHPDRLPEARAVRCPHEYAQKEEAWDRLLSDYYTPAMRQ